MRNFFKRIGLYIIASTANIFKVENDCNMKKYKRLDLSEFECEVEFECERYQCKTFICRGPNCNACLEHALNYITEQTMEMRHDMWNKYAEHKYKRGTNCLYRNGYYDCMGAECEGAYCRECINVALDTMLLKCEEREHDHWAHYKRFKIHKFNVK